MDDTPVNLLTPKTQLSELPDGPGPKWPYFFVLLILLVAGALVIGRYGANDEYGNGSVLQPKHLGFLYRVKNFFFNSNNLLEGQSDDRVNILVLGVGGAGHDGPYLSDTSIIVSLKPSTKEVALIAVPRDLAVNVTGHGWRKINSASAFGEAANPGQGGEFARQVFSQAFNLSIPYYVRVDFKAFSDLVDALGGVNINVPKAFTDTQYPGANYSFTTIHFDQGDQFMAGDQALIYARSRHGDSGEGSDFARSRRQEQIIMAIKDKALSAGTLLNPARINNMIGAFANHVTTNLDFEQIIYLASFAKDLKTPAIKLVLDSSPNGLLVNATGEDGAFILSPKSGNFSEIDNAMMNVFANATTGSVLAVNIPSVQPVTDYFKPSGSATSTNLEIQNGTWRAGLAARVGESLSKTGFGILRVGNSLKRPIDQTVIYVLNSKVPGAVSAKLSGQLSAPVVTVLPDWLQENYDNTSTPENEQGMKHNPNADILIVLGANYKE